MLGSTAQNLFWLSRYVERAENMARLLEVGYRMSLTSRREGGAAEHLVSMMQAAEVDEAFAEKHEIADVASGQPLHAVRRGQSVLGPLLPARGAHQCPLGAHGTDDSKCGRRSTPPGSSSRRSSPRDITGGRLPELLAWVKQVTHQFRGALISTILRDDGYAFRPSAAIVERADNTARILDMKYYVLLPRATLIGGDVDIQQWTLILRAASAHRSYRHVYHDRYKAWNIADYLILRPEMPRSLSFCSPITRTLDMLADTYGKRLPCHEAVADVTAMLEGNNMDRIFQSGLHEFLTEFIARNNRLTEALSESYNFY